MPRMEHLLCFCNQENDSSAQNQEILGNLQLKLKVSLPCLTVTLISLATAAVSANQSLIGYRSTNQHLVKNSASLDSGQGPFRLALTIKWILINCRGYKCFPSPQPLASLSCLWERGGGWSGKMYSRPSPWSCDSLLKSLQVGTQLCLFVESSKPLAKRHAVRIITLL